MIDELDNAAPRGEWVEEENEATDSWFEGAGDIWDLTSLVTHGDDAPEESREMVFKTFPNYKENEEAYKAYSDNTSWWLHWSTEDKNRAFMEEGIDSGRFTLDKNGEVHDANKTWDSFTYDYDAVKGALLARENGWTPEVETAAYKTYVNDEVKRLQTKTEGATTGQTVGGVIASFVFNPWTAAELVASPARITGATIKHGAALAFGSEFVVAALGEIGREAEIRRHKDKLGEEYGLWESVKNIVMGASIAGGIRAGGSAAVDGLATRGLDSTMTAAYLEAQVLKQAGMNDIQAAKWKMKFGSTEKEVVNRFIRREQYKLTEDTNAHIDAAYKAEHDIAKGEKVDVEEHLDVDGDEKFGTQGAETTKLEDEVNAQYTNDIEEADVAVNKNADEVAPYNPDDPYDGMATPEAAKETVAGVEDINPIIKTEFDDIETKIAEQEAKIKGTTVSAQGSGQLGGSMGGGTLGAMEGAYEEIVEGKDLTAEDYLARIVGGAVAGNMIGRTAKAETGLGTFVATTPNAKGAFSDIHIKKTMREIDDSLSSIKKVEIFDSKREDTLEKIAKAEKLMKDKLKDSGLTAQQRKNVKGNVKQYIEARKKELPEIKSESSIRVGGGKLGNILHHPELFKRYPKLKNVDVIMDEKLEPANAWYEPMDNEIGISKELYKLDEGLQIETILHEIQHVIQTNEGWARGGNIKEFGKKVTQQHIDEARKYEMDNFTDWQNALDYNKYNAGEISFEDTNHWLLKSMDEGIDLTEAEYVAEMEFIKGDKPFYEMDRAYIDKYLAEARVRLDEAYEIKVNDPMRKYLDLWGEQQSRDVEYRRKIPAKDRNKVKPFDMVGKRETPITGKPRNPIVKYDKPGTINMSEDYKMQHTAPEPEGANSGDDLTDIYPDSPSDKNFERYYGTGDKASDKESIAAMKKMEGNPDADVTIYRAAPKGKEINEGDWITLSKNYAKEHGEAHMDGNYEILELKVKAKDVYTNGDSINEWGYYPQGDN